MKVTLLKGWFKGISRKTQDSNTNTAVLISEPTTNKKTSSSYLKLFVFMAMSVLSLQLSAQSIFTNPITGTNPGQVAGNYTTGQTVNANITVSGISKGSGIVGNAANDRYAANTWNVASAALAISGNRFFEFTLTPNANFKIDFVSFVYTGQASGTGATSTFLRSSVDGFTANIGATTITGTTISLSGAAFQNITSATTFRYYGFGASAASGTMSINDFTFNGTVSSSVAAAPVISSVLTASKNIGSATPNYTITANNSPASFNATGLPPGLTVNTTTGVISGTPTSITGSPFTVAISATNTSGTDTKNLIYTINAVAPVINSSLTASKNYGSASPSYFITATNSPTSFDAIDLPPGLTLNTLTGEISGTPTSTAGSPYNVTIGANNSAGFDVKSLIYTINKAGVTISNLTADNKEYNFSPVATLGGTPTLNGVIAADVANVSLGGTVVANFANANVGTAKPVTVSGYSLSGSAAVNYTLTQPSGLSANIFSKPVSIAGLIADTKVYNGSASATFTGTPSLLGVVAGDEANVSIAGSGVATFANASVGTAKPVSFTGYSLSGSSALNYSLSQPSSSADIDPLNLTITGLTADNKVENGNTTAILSGTALLNGVIGLDDVILGGTPVANFNDTLVGINKPVTVTGYSISGAQSGNYTVSQPTGLTANITSAALTNQTITFNTLPNATYGDANFALTATASSGLAVSYVSSDTTVASVSGNIVTVLSVGSTNITASQNGNGTFNPAPNVIQSLTIDPKALTVSGAIADDKIYDANTITSVSNGSLIGVLAADLANVVLVNGAGTGSFATKNAGSGIAVSTNLSIIGSAVTNYTLVQPLGLTASIFQKNLSINGVSGDSKTYNASNTTTILGSASLVGVVSSDLGNVILGGTPVASFADANVGTNKTVTITGYSISGSEAANYNLGQPLPNNANIIAASLSISGVSASSRAYDGTSNAQLAGTTSLLGVFAADLSNVIVGGTPVASFNNKVVGVAKPVSVVGYSITGSSASNYFLTQPSLSANINALAISVDNAQANNKTFDGNTSATISGTLNGVLGGDIVNLNGTGVFASSNTGTGILVTSTSTISGADAINYSLTQPLGLSANIIAGACSPTAGTANWNFTAGTASPSSAAITNLTVSDITRGQDNLTAAALITTTSASSGYTGSTGTSNAGAAAFTGALNSTTSTYFSFTLTPSSGTAQLTSISFGTRSTSTGPQAYALRSSLDNYASDLATGTISNTSVWSLKSNTGITGAVSASSTPIIFRIYGHNGTGNAGTSANWRVDDITLGVAVGSSNSLSSSLTPPAICSGSTFTYTPTSSNVGATFSWTRAAVAGISNAAIITPQTANPSEVLVNTTSSPVSVVYVYAIEANNCVSTQNVTVIVNPSPATPTVSVVNNCGSSVLTASNFTGSLLWSTGQTTTSITVTTAGSYTVLQTVGGCTSALATGVAAPNSVPAAPTVSVTVQPSCTLPTGTIVISAPTGSEITYSIGGVYQASNTFAGVAPGIYSVSVQNSNGCISLSSSVTVNAVPASPSAPTVTVVDSCGSSRLTASNFTGTLLWSNGQTTPSIVVTSAGVYTVQQTVNGCVSVTGSGSAAPIAAPVTPLVNVVDACGSSTLSVTNATGTILWNTGETTSSIVVNSAGTFTVTFTSNGCVSANGSAIAAPFAIPNAPIGVNGSRVNSGTVNLSATTNVGETIDWYDAATGGNLLLSASTNFTTPVIAATTSYYAEAINGNGCISVRTEVIASVIPGAPAAPVAVNGSRCGQGPGIVTIDAIAGSGETIDWYATATGGTALLSGSTSFTTPSLTVTTTYYAEARNLDGGLVSVSRTAVLATLGDIPADATAGGPFARCGMGNVLLEVSFPAGTTADWYTAASGGTLLRSGSQYYFAAGLTATTTFYAQVRNRTTGCLSANRVAVVATVNPLPLTAIGTGASLCGSGSVTISASAGVDETIDWYDSPSGGVLLLAGSFTYPTPVLSSNATYYAQARNTVTGCLARSRAYVTATIGTVNAPVVVAQGSRCGPGIFSLEVSVTSGNTNDWYDAPVGGNLLRSGSLYYTISLQTTTVYYAQARNRTSGCLSTRTAVTATVNPLPAVAVGVPASLCGSGSLTLGATVPSGITTDWYSAASGGTLLVSGTSSYTTPVLNSSTTYYVQARNETTGCLSKTRAAVTATVGIVNPSTSIIPGIGGSGTRCGAGRVNLEVSSPVGTRSNWYANPTGGVALRSNSNYFTTPVISVTTTYYVEAVNTISGCAATRTAVTATIDCPPIRVANTNFSSTEATVYPNPNNGLFTISINSSDVENSATIQIRDISGRLVLEQLNNANVNGNIQVDINKTDLPSGFYTMNYYLGSEKGSVKFVVVQ